MGAISDDYMTVQEVMSEINARAPSTVTRLIRTENNEDGPLVGEKIPGHGWLIRRSSVAKLLAREAKVERRVGYTRGGRRS